MTREVAEWIGRTDDTACPPRVRLRIFERHGGRCHISGRLIRAGEVWQVEHIVAIINGGQNRESNMAPALTAPHKVKTAEDLKQKSTNYRKRAKHLGLLPARQKIQSAGFRKAPPQRSASRPIERRS